MLGPKKEWKGCGLTSESLSGRKVVFKLYAGIESGSIEEMSPLLPLLQCPHLADTVGRADSSNSDSGQGVVFSC